MDLRVRIGSNTTTYQNVDPTTLGEWDTLRLTNIMRRIATAAKQGLHVEVTGVDLPVADWHRAHGW